MAHIWLFLFRIGVKKNILRFNLGIDDKSYVQVSTNPKRPMAVTDV